MNRETGRAMGLPGLSAFWVEIRVRGRKRAGLGEAAELFRFVSQVKIF